MIEYSDFLEILKPMKAVFYIPDKFEDYFKILYDMLKRKESFILRDAVQSLIENQDTKRFPLPAEFRKAVTEAIENRTRDSVDPSQRDLLRDFYCDKCANGGIKLVEKFDSFYQKKRFVAVPCDCEEGKKIAEGWRLYFERKRQRRKKK